MTDFDITMSKKRQQSINDPTQRKQLADADIKNLKLKDLDTSSEAGAEQIIEVRTDEHETTHQFKETVANKLGIPIDGIEWYCFPTSEKSDLSVILNEHENVLLNNINIPSNILVKQKVATSPDTTDKSLKKEATSLTIASHVPHQTFTTPDTLKSKPSDGSLTSNSTLVQMTSEGNSSTKHMSSSPLPNASSGFRRGLCGLNNQGSTCYMNSALQCLSNIPAMTEFFLKCPANQYMSKKICRAYSELIEKMWSGRYNTIEPSDLKRYLGEVAPIFADYNQHDSHEFINSLLEALNDEMKSAITGSASRHSPLISTLFHGELRTVVRCPCKGSDEVSTNVFTFLPLPLTSSHTVHKCSSETIFEIEYIQSTGHIEHLKIHADGTIEDLIHMFFGHYNSLQDKTVQYKTSSACNDPPVSERVLVAEVEDNTIKKTHKDLNKQLINVSTNKLTLFQLPKTVYNKRIMECQFCCLQDRKRFRPPLFFAASENLKELRNDIKQWMSSFSHTILHIDPMQFNEYSWNYIDRSYSHNQYLTDSGSSENDVILDCMHESKLTLRVTFDQKNSVLTVLVAPEWVCQYQQNKRHIQSAQREQINVSHSIPSSVSNLATCSSTLTLQQCLKNYAANILIKERSSWYCKHCKQNQLVTKQTTITELPNVLILQLKRFGFDRHDTKIDTYVECPIDTLNLREFVPLPNKAGFVYELIAVSNHLGSQSLSSGHYTTHAKNRFNNQWYSFDDLRISSLEKDEVISKNAYVLVYQQKN